MKLFSVEHEQVLESIYGKVSAQEYSELLRSFSKVLEEEVAPFSLALDEGREKISRPRKVIFDQGVSKLALSPELGGMGLPFGIYATAMEISGAADASTAMSVGIHNTVVDAIARFGSEEQKTRWLPSLLSGTKLAAFGLTEPSSGSDARSMHTTATKEVDGYMLEGSKMFITNAGEADVYLMFAATRQGHSAFLVEAANPGLRVGKALDEKLGMRGSHTAEVRLERCRVDADSLVGNENEAFEDAKQLLDPSRIVMGMICVGIARAAYESTLAYIKGRELFGKRLSDFQLTREKIANASIEISAARMLCIHASRLKEAGKPFSSEAAKGKVLATEMAARTCDSAIQLLGGYGYTSNDVHRHWRDARLLTIGEGTSEILRLLIASKELEKEG